MSIIAALLAVVVPVVAGFVAKLIAEANEYVANLPGPFPSLIGVVVAYGASVLAQALGLALPGSLAGFDQNVIASVLSAVVALILHTNGVVQARRARSR